MAISEATLAKIRQRQATTGRANVNVKDLLEADLAAQQSQQLGREQLALSRERYEAEKALASEALAQQKLTGIISGIGTLGELGITGYETYRQFNPATPTKALSVPMTTPTATAIASPTTTALTSTPQVMGMEPARQGMQFAITPAETAITQPSTMSSVLGTAGSVAGIGLGAKAYEEGHRRTGATQVGAGIGGLAAGPVGAAAGAGIGYVVGSIIDLSVICKELHRQEQITGAQLLRVNAYRRRHVRPSTYRGYLRWAPKVVRWMQGSRAFSRVVWPIGKRWVRAMESVVDEKTRASWLDRGILKATIVFSDMLAGKGRG